MIYTSYFGKLNKIGNNYTTFSIARYSPKWYNGETISVLAPSPALLKWWKNCAQTKEDKVKYIEQYWNETLADKNPNKFAEALLSISDKEPVLLCYEKSGDFCHRYIIKYWLNKAGIECEELFSDKIINWEDV